MAKVTLKGRCPFCGKEWAVEVSEEGYNAWRFGELAQIALADNTPEERECLISGICPECQESIFGDCEDIGE